MQNITSRALYPLHAFLGDRRIKTSARPLPDQIAKCHNRGIRSLAIDFTSNISLKASVVSRFQTNRSQTHHSCALARLRFTSKHLTLIPTHFTFTASVAFLCSIAALLTLFPQLAAFELTNYSILVSYQWRRTLNALFSLLISIIDSLLYILNALQLLHLLS